ncbi:MAG: bifunctional (p)ppGpp synthetase/guanosine-3',5'-bis(diphosphate) 3'-pyrophosphohydrolase [Proteobacteria bacterium]|nr:bifunctional (p)ppGpp synthetase/guanosine-3',5'-bis(diphosphate) 3'-pyrophosphohydrolase [Pseudomonadota bacterium]MBU1717051.1 bifunctional (p)ppGpp synthetase/guanosine-3',5'-bis(diphosphate) 3'-pyrophosphohydrolase [Pseudomonadota bacterium]
MSQIEEIITMVSGYLTPEDISLLRKAYIFAQKIYSGKHRLSGRPYIYHALCVSNILARLQLDVHTVIAGLLHGALKESAACSEKELSKEFGPEVAGIVSGATKITNVQFDSRLAYQAENIRKMFLAMSADIRVLILKLADRLHDMQSLEFVSKIKQKEMAREAKDLYAPLASRLGIDWVKRELEDYSFMYLHPEEYADLAGKIDTTLNERQQYVEEVKEILTVKLKEQNLVDFRILGRPKHLYSIYKKLIAQNIPLEKVFDKVAFRIITKKVGECYETLGLLHSLWQPVSGRFRDFISTPKGNMYQSLHTTVVGPRGEFMEVQIRTEEMDQIANDGIAAHWAYKEGKQITQKDARLFQWLKQLVQSIQELQDPREFMEAVKGELREIEVYALTPNGEVKEFPDGSTPLDFAYAIHTQVGDHCAGAKVNGRIVPLKHKLKNGEQVEIITSVNQKPNRGWLSLVKTSRAKSRIRQWLKREEQERALKVGREICERELRKHNINLKKLVKAGHLKELLQQFSCNSLDDLIRGVGAGKIKVKLLVEKIRPEELQEESELRDAQAAELTQKAKDVASRRRTDRESAITIDGVDDMLVRISQCCMPVPGDEIMGFITSGRGISIHKADCRNFLATDPQKHIEVDWSINSATVHRVQVQIVAQDQKGLLAALGSKISAEDANIINLEAHTSSANLAIFNLVLEVASLGHLARLLQHVRNIDGVLEAKRR